MSGEAGSRVIRGEVVLAPDTPGQEVAELVIQIEDVSRADAPSVVVGEQRVASPRLEPGAPISFSIEIPADRFDEKALYSLRAHGDVSGSHQVEKGDLLSTQSYPVATRGYPVEARVEIRKI